MYLSCFEIAECDLRGILAVVSSRRNVQADVPLLTVVALVVVLPW